MQLLDAAHIIPDSDPKGFARVPNGRDLYKIHRAAYDSNVTGISPDLSVRGRRDVMLEVDGPILKNGIQAMDGNLLTTPNTQSLKPEA